MGEIVIHDINEGTPGRLTAQATLQGRSLEDVAKTALDEAAARLPAGRASRAAVRARAAEIRAGLAGRPQTDSAELLRGGNGVNSPVDQQKL